MIIENFRIKDVLLILCLKSIMANNNPAEPPKKAVANNVFSGIRDLFLIARYLSYPAKIKAVAFISKK